MATNRAGAPLLAYVLHQYDWSETSLIVELFTRAQGRVVVAAKGAKRPTSNFRAVLLPFVPILAHLGKTPADEQGEVHNLRSAEWAGGQPLLGAASLLSGFYLNELLLKLLARQDAHENLFDAYAEAVHALQAADEASVQLILRSFELMLLRQLGVLPELNGVTLTVEALDPDGRYSLQAETGVVAVMAGEPGVPGRAMVQLEAALSSGHGAAVRAAARPVLAALRAPLRRVLHYHLGSPVLRTRQVLADVHKLIDPPSARP